MFTPAFMVFFIGSFVTDIFGMPKTFQPAWWLIGYIVFVGADVRALELSLNVMMRDLRVKVP